MVLTPEIDSTQAVSGFNSYIVDGPNQEVAADLADFSRNSIYNRDYGYIFIAVDAFTKFAWAVPIKKRMHLSVQRH